MHAVFVYGVRLRGQEFGSLGQLLFAGFQIGKTKFHHTPRPTQQILWDESGGAPAQLVGGFCPTGGGIDGNIAIRKYRAVLLDFILMFVQQLVHHLSLIHI